MFNPCASTVLSVEFCANCEIIDSENQAKKKLLT